MVSVGKNGYRYSEYPDLAKIQAKRYNTSISNIADTVDHFYDIVQEQLGIPVIIFDDYPSDMCLKSIVSNPTSVIAKFEYEGEFIYFKEAKPEQKNILKMEMSDRKDVKTFYNKWLGLDLSIKENILNNDRKEYSVSINTEEGYYLLEGVMNLDEFYEIVSNLIYR
jgi:hypothetical protein